MMLIVLKYDDNKQAEDLVCENTHLSEGEIVALYRAPTLFCNSADGHLKGKKKTQAAYTRGMKYGWWVCAVCKKPTKAWGSHLPAVLSSAISQLDLVRDLWRKKNDEQGEEAPAGLQQDGAAGLQDVS